MPGIDGGLPGLDGDFEGAVDGIEGWKWAVQGEGPRGGAVKRFAFC